jgi:hypothetical protein
MTLNELFLETAMRCLAARLSGLNGSSMPDEFGLRARLAVADAHAFIRALPEPVRKELESPPADA